MENLLTIEELEKTIVTSMDVSDNHEVSWENNGIGHYEYWGATGFDRGQDYEVMEGDGYFSFCVPANAIIRTEDGFGLVFSYNGKEETDDIGNFIEETGCVHEKVKEHLPYYETTASINISYSVDEVDFNEDEDDEYASITVTYKAELR